MNRPSFHLTAPRNWINDPNGFIWYRGQYHLFYQHFPYANRWGTMHWGHAVSPDLAHWTQRDIALFPTVKGDKNGCFSGSALEKDGAMRLYYTGVNYGSTPDDDIHVANGSDFVSCQLQLTSPDGETFDNFGGKTVAVPVLDDPQFGGAAHTRDPKVWEEDGVYYMLLGSQYQNGHGACQPQLLVYASGDGSSWSFLGHTRKPGFGWMFECPDYYELDGRGLVTLSPMGLSDGLTSQGELTYCGDCAFDPRTGAMDFEVEDLRLLDCGKDLYAAQTNLDEAGRRTQVAWLRMPRPLDGEDWFGLIALPRVVSRRDGAPCFDVHPNVRACFTHEIPLEKADAEKPLRLTAELGEGDGLEVGGYAVTLKNGALLADRTRVFPGDAPKYELVSAAPAGAGRHGVEIYVDYGVVETFLDGGAQTVTHGAYGLTGGVRPIGNARVRCYEMDGGNSK